MTNTPGIPDFLHEFRRKVDGHIFTTRSHPASMPHPPLSGSVRTGLRTLLRVQPREPGISLDDGLGAAKLKMAPDRFPEGPVRTAAGDGTQWLVSHLRELLTRYAVSTVISMNLYKKKVQKAMATILNGSLWDALHYEGQN